MGLPMFPMGGGFPGFNPFQMMGNGFPGQGGQMFNWMDPFGMNQQNQQRGQSPFGTPQARQQTYGNVPNGNDINWGPGGPPKGGTTTAPGQGYKTPSNWMAQARAIGNGVTPSPGNNVMAQNALVNNPQPYHTGRR